MSKFWQTMMNEWPDIASKVGDHVYLSLAALVLACVVSVPLGIYLTRHPKWSTPIITIVSVVQTIPSLALLGFMIPLFGIGTVPALIALVLYALLPILRNTYTGILEVDSALLEAGRGMGMTKRQILWLVELPLARTVVMAGVRTSTVQTIGVATLATFIGAGGLGDLIIRGIDMIDTQMILAGAIPAAVLAILFDFGLLWIDKLLTPKGLRTANRATSEGPRSKLSA